MAYLRKILATPSLDFKGGVTKDKKKKRIINTVRILQSQTNI